MSDEAIRRRKLVQSRTARRILRLPPRDPATVATVATVARRTALEYPVVSKLIGSFVAGNKTRLNTHPSGVARPGYRDPDAAARFDPMNLMDARWGAGPAGPASNNEGGGNGGGGEESGGGGGGGEESGGGGGGGGGNSGGGGRSTGGRKKRKKY